MSLSGSVCESEIEIERVSVSVSVCVYVKVVKQVITMDWKQADQTNGCTRK